MSKYYRLKDFLNDQDRDHIPMTFSDIEKVLEFELPASKQYPAWWSNNPSNNPMTREWLDAGYETQSVNTAGGRLVFRRVMKVPRQNVSTSPEDVGNENRERRPLHPGIGFMKGLITIEEGFDVSGPFSDEAWDEGYLGEDRLMESKAGKLQK
ncbi:hypothetical protein QBK99_17980 [Corticibacterium sp. UT-5YL-CI-8]|nr:hypothetical protein [Tianweitania sp. UT-5YL-CI-8]